MSNNTQQPNDPCRWPTKEEMAVRIIKQHPQSRKNGLTPEIVLSWLNAETVEESCRLQHEFWEGVRRKREKERLSEPKREPVPGITIINATRSI